MQLTVINAEDEIPEAATSTSAFRHGQFDDAESDEDDKVSVATSRRSNRSKHLRTTITKFVASRFVSSRQPPSSNQGNVCTETKKISSLSGFQRMTATTIKSISVSRARAHFRLTT